MEKFPLFHDVLAKMRCFCDLLIKFSDIWKISLFVAIFRQNLRSSEIVRRNFHFFRKPLTKFVLFSQNLLFYLFTYLLFFRHVLFVFFTVPALVWQNSHSFHIISEELVYFRDISTRLLFLRFFTIWRSSSFLWPCFVRKWKNSVFFHNVLANIMCVFAIFW